MRPILERLRHAPNLTGWRLYMDEEVSEWFQSLRALFAGLPRDALSAEDEGKISDAKAVWVQYVQWERVVFVQLKPEIVSVLFDEQGNWRRSKSSAGNHRVFFLQTDARHSFWVKVYPEQPSIEYV